MYTRMEACTLSGLDIDNFKSLAHRGQLPVAQSQSGVRRLEGYSAIDVITIAVGCALSNRAGYDRGLQASTAMSLASALKDWICRAYSDGADDIWAGAMGARVHGIGAKNPKAGWYVGGSLRSIAVEIERENARLNSGVTRVFLVNVSEVIREVQTRARQARLFFPSNMSEAA